MFATSNLALRFLLEVAGLAILAYSGFQIFAGPARWVAAIAGPVLLAVVWALVVAPKAANALAPVTRDLIGSGLLLGVAVGLAMAGQPRPALAFAALVVVNAVLLLWMSPTATPATGASR